MITFAGNVHAMDAAGAVFCDSTSGGQRLASLVEDLKGELGTVTSELPIKHKNGELEVIPRGHPYYFVGPFNVRHAREPL